MLYEYKYDNGVRVKIWKNERPFGNCKVQKQIVKRLQREHSKTEHKQEMIVIVELMLPRNHNNYGMLGVEYRKGGDETNIIIDVNDCKGELYEANIAVMPDIVHKGIPAEYVDGIIKGVEGIRKETIKCGTYIFNIGAHGEVGSSQNMFYVITNILIKILDITLIDSSIIKKIILEEVVNN